MRCLELFWVYLKYFETFLQLGIFFSCFFLWNSILLSVFFVSYFWNPEAKLFNVGENCGDPPLGHRKSNLLSFILYFHHLQIKYRFIYLRCKVSFRSIFKSIFNFHVSILTLLSFIYSVYIIIWVTLFYSFVFNYLFMFYLSLFKC